MTREEAIKWFENAVPKNCSECPKEHDYSCSYANSLRCEAYMLARIALHEQMERKRGEWEKVIPSKSAAKWSTKVCCSVCRVTGYTRYNFCPNCGADMRGEQNESN